MLVHSVRTPAVLLWPTGRYDLDRLEELYSLRGHDRVAAELLVEAAADESGQESGLEVHLAIMTKHDLAYDLVDRE